MDTRELKFKRYFSDPSDRPTGGTRWHSRSDCSGLYCTEISDEDLAHMGVDPGPSGKCRVCERQDQALARLLERVSGGQGVRGVRQSTIDRAVKLGFLVWEDGAYRVV